MNVQQSKQTKITLAALALVFAAVFACMPQLAFADEAPAQGASDAEQSKEQLQDAGVSDDAKDSEAQQASKLLKTSQVAQSSEGQVATASKEAVAAEELSQGAASSGIALEAQSTTVDKSQQLSAKATSSEKSQQLTAQATHTSTDKVGLSYSTHVQNDGWKSSVKAGETSGTTGRALRLEGIKISLTGMGDNKGSILYQTHVQNEGWQEWKSDGAMSGTKGQALRLEGIRIKLVGDIATHYDVFYRTHVQNIGWQGWQCNGELSGTTGQSLRLEAIEIKLSPKTEEAAGKGTQTTGVRYEAHVQNDGWQEWVGDGQTTGTTGRGLRVESLKVIVSGGAYSGGVKYKTHVQNKGWTGWKHDGYEAGSTGEGLRIEALMIELTGVVADKYDVYYCAHVQNYGWLDWAKNGEVSGSTGLGLRVEALQIRLVKKNGSAPGPTANPIVVIRELDGIDISSWQAGINLYNVPGDFVIVKATGGTGYTNPYYWNMAKDTLGSGKLLGLYHFARESSCSGSARDEADHFVNTIANYVGSAVLVLDYEADAINQGPGWAEAWLDHVYERTGVRPVIYMSKSVANEQDWSSVASKYKLWGAQYLYRYYNYPQTGYVDDPELTSGWGPWGKPTIYQYNSTSYLNGWGGSLDMNKFYGSKDDWGKLAAKS